jgi:hypothetical protein
MLIESKYLAKNTAKLLPYMKNLSQLAKDFTGNRKKYQSEVIPRKINDFQQFF